MAIHIFLIHLGCNSCTTAIGNGISTAEWELQRAHGKEADGLHCVAKARQKTQFLDSRGACRHSKCIYSTDW